MAQMLCIQPNSSVQHYLSAADDNVQLENNNLSNEVNCH